VAASVELHKTVMENGVMKMQPQESVEVPAHNKVEFKPGSLHIMLVNLKQDLKPGDRLELTLQFDKAGAKTIQVSVQEQ
jgi:copper(I)-binding protein